MTTNQVYAYPLPSPQQNANFTISIQALSTDVQVVSNQATMYAIFQGTPPPAYQQAFRWIPVGTAWEDSPGGQYVNFITVCTFNFGSYVLAVVQSVS